MRIILSRSVYSLNVYISCIMQHVNNVFIVCFQRNLRKSVPESRETQFRAFVWYSIYIAKVVLEYSVTRVVTSSLEISF
jgi:hypothetical protein